MLSSSNIALIASWRELVFLLLREVVEIEIVGTSSVLCSSSGVGTAAGRVIMAVIAVRCGGQKTKEMAKTRAKAKAKAN